jgi:hypothetical protein
MSDRDQLIGNQNLKIYNSNSNSSEGGSNEDEYVFKADNENSSLIVSKASQDQLDTILHQIGMGKFQYLLFLLCGFGWMSDNVSLISYITIYSITNLILIDVATSKISSTYIISLYLYKQNFYFILTIGSYRYFTPNSEYLLLYYFIYLYLQYYF